MVRALEYLFGLYVLLLAAAAYINAVPWAPRGGEVERRRKVATVVWWLIVAASISFGFVIAVVVEVLAKDQQSFAGLAMWIIGLFEWAVNSITGIWTASQVLKRFPFNDESGSAQYRICEGDKPQ